MKTSNFDNSFEVVCDGQNCAVDDGEYKAVCDNLIPGTDYDITVTATKNESSETSDAVAGTTSKL